MKEDLGPILIAHIAELPVGDERVDVVPEMVQQLLVAHNRRIENDADRLGVPGAAAWYLSIRRIYNCSTGVAGCRGYDAANLVEVGFRAPETARREGRHGLPLALWLRLRRRSDGSRGRRVDFENADETSP